MNDPRVTGPFGRPSRLSPKDHETWFRKLKQDRTQAVFAILAADTKEHIGNAGLKHINPYHRSAETWVYIGEGRYRRRGLAYAALESLVRRAFTKMRLHRIQAWMLESNLPSFKLFKKCGFKEEGKLREAFFCKGRFHNLRLLSRLRK